MIRRWLLALIIVAVVCGTGLAVSQALSARAPEPNVTASRYDVTMDLLPDGSLDVVERITMRVGSTPITWFERRVPSRRTDGLTNAVALIDGREAPPLTNGVGARIRRGGRTGLEVRWQFPPTANGTRTLELRYRALHVLDRGLAGPHLDWTALPARHQYPIDAARVILRAPQGALATAVSARGGDIQPATSWQDGLTVTGGAIDANESIGLDVVFATGTISPVEPGWAVTAEHAQKLVPAFVAAAISLLVIGAGALIMIRARLLALGLIDADRLATARGLAMSGVVLLLGGLAGMSLLAVTLADRLGPALLWIPAAISADGIAFLVAGRAIARYTSAVFRCGGDP